MIGALVLFIVLVQFWLWKNVSWYASFTKKQGGICWHSKLAQDKICWQFGRTDQTCHTKRSDWSGQLCQIVNWTSPLRRSRRDDRNAYIEHPIWNPDEEIMPLGKPVPRSDRSDWSRDRSDWSRDRSDRSEKSSPS